MAFATLMVLFTVVAVTLSGYLTISNQVIGSYNTNDQIFPTSIIIQRMLRSQVEPAPTPTASNQVTSPMCPVLNAPCPPFSLGNVSTTSVTFYANVGSEVVERDHLRPGAGPDHHVRDHAHQVRDLSLLHLDLHCDRAGAERELLPVLGGLDPALHLTTAPLVTLVSLSGVVNGQANLLNPATPIFTYNTLDPYQRDVHPQCGHQQLRRLRRTATHQTGSRPSTVVPTDTCFELPRPTPSRVWAWTSRCQQGTQKESYQENAFVGLPAVVRVVPLQHGGGINHARRNTTKHCRRQSGSVAPARGFGADRPGNGDRRHHPA